MIKVEIYLELHGTIWDNFDPDGLILQYHNDSILNQRLKQYNCRLDYPHIHFNSEEDYIRFILEYS